MWIWVSHKLSQSQKLKEVCTLICTHNCYDNSVNIPLFSYYSVLSISDSDRLFCFLLWNICTLVCKSTQQHKSRTHTHTYYSYCYVLSEQRKIGILCSSQIQLLHPSINNIYTLPSSQQSQFLIVSCIQLLHDCLLFTTQAFDITDRHTDRTSEHTPRHPCLTRNTNICC